MNDKVSYKIIVCLLLGIMFLNAPAEAETVAQNLVQQQAALVKTSDWILKQAFKNKKVACK